MITESCFIEVNTFWKNYKGAKFTFELFPIWKKQSILPKPSSRIGEKFYYRMCFPQNSLKYFMYNKAQKGDNDHCRWCGKDTETVDHILRNCSDLDYKKLKFSCVKHNIEYNIRNLLTTDS